MTASWRAEGVEATSSPSRPAKGERPRCTARAPSAPPIRPAKLAATVGSRTTGQERETGLPAPLIGTARSALPGAAGAAEAEAGPAAPPPLGQGLQVGEAVGGLVGGGDPGRGGDR